jgi:hypothetical protein
MMQAPEAEFQRIKAVDSLVWRLVLPYGQHALECGSFVPSNVMVMAGGWLMVDGQVRCHHPLPLRKK